MFNIKNNSNYLARIVKLPALQKCPNADKLQICNLFGNSVITSLTAKEGDVYIYFSLECAINPEFLSWSNSFTNPELNKDKTKRGFFSNSGRVKCVKLRGARSEGYIIPITEIQNWLFEEKGKHFKITENLINQDFDYFDDILICEKYVNKQELARLNREKCAQNRKDKKKVRVSKIIDDQFRLSQDVDHLGKYVREINPESIIAITNKIHGCNFSVARVLCKKPLKWHERVLKYCGVNVVDRHYDMVYASRGVIKNAYADKEHNHFYDSDVWGIVADKLKDCLLDGVSLYGEIGGYTPSGQYIQKNYDYGCPVGQLDFWIFRITYTNFSGQVFEFSWQQVKDYCNKFGIKHVPEFYYGKAKDLFNISLDEHWHENFLKLISETFLEKDCDMCTKNKVPAEGIVLTIQSGYYTPYKHKSFQFRLRESEALDSGEVDIETMESVSLDIGKEKEEEIKAA